MRTYILKAAVFRHCIAGAALLLGLVSAHAQSRPVLTGCASNTPPFVWMQGGHGVSGFSFEWFVQIAGQLKRTPNVIEMPWARCLHEVRSGGIDMAIDAYDDAERRKLFWYSASYYTLTPQIFYRVNDDKAPWPVQSVERLKTMRGCGVHEYTYEHYGLETGNLDLNAVDDEHMLKMLQGGRCDFAMEELEYIIGGRRSRATWPNESDIRAYKPAWAQGPKLHFLIGRDRSGGEELLQQVNASIALLTKNGVPKALAKKHFDANPSAALKMPGQ
jgi:ABC-type amino acid transport substrate-binding protein